MAKKLGYAAAAIAVAILVVPTVVIRIVWDRYEELGIGEDRIPGMMLMLKRISDLLLARWYFPVAALLLVALCYVIRKLCQRGR